MVSAADLIVLKQEMEKIFDEREVKLTTGWKAEIDALMVKLEEMTKKYDNIKEHENKKEKTLMHVKNLIPSKLDKTEDWRKWRQEVEDYTEEVFPGMKKVLDKARKSNDIANQLFFISDDLDV